MHSPLRNTHVRLHVSQAAKFITCGLIGACIEFSIIKILVGTYHLTPYFVYLPSALIPATFVFFFNKHVTFRAVGRTTEQTKRFLMVYIVAFIVNYLLSSAFYTVGSRFTGVILVGVLFNQQRIAYAAKALAIGTTSVFNYSFSHFFIFRKSDDSLLPETPVF